MPELTTDQDYDFSLVHLTGYRCPVVLELFRHDVPIAAAALFVGVILGYAWARAAYTTFVR